jgi:uncharacterized protein DUF3570
MRSKRRQTIIFTSAKKHPAVAEDSVAAVVVVIEGNGMSRRKDPSVSAALAAATCSLLGTTATTAVHAQEEPKWDINTSAFFYGEDANRVQDFSVKSIIRRLFADDRVFSFGLTVDTLTGASPNGAITQDVAQTFTSASGNSTYDAATGELPLDTNFRDTRVAITANWQQPIGESSQISYGMSASKEIDYLHLGVNGQFAMDFNQRNTTVSAGFAYARDEVDPFGGTAIPLSPVRDIGDNGNRGGTANKDIADIVVGVSQVLSRNLVVLVNYSYSNQSGYLNNIYKVLSVVDGTTGDTIPRIPANGGGPSHELVFEGRPDDRTKHSLYTQAKYFMGGNVLDASYRYMTDDWDIDSHTVDLRYRWPVGNDKYLEPHLRLYTQTEADFYRLSITDGAPLPLYASSDYRLGNFDAITVGMKYGWKTRNENDMSIRAEFYQQSGSIPNGQIIGNQAGRDNYPDLNAIIVQFSYRFKK